MTLIVAANTPESIWMLADRCLSARGRPLRDDACKIMFLETNDGVAILGYAGLGATAHGIEPSKWMSAVLRGRKLPLEQCLAVLAAAARQQLPRHMIRMPGRDGPNHSVIIPAFVGQEPRVYTIDLAFAVDRRSYRFRHTRHVIGKPLLHAYKTPPLAIGGSGAQYLLRDRTWTRRLLRLIRAYDRELVSPRAVANHLANLNYEVHLGTKDKSVGPRCVVAWRNRRGGIHKGGGGHEFYTGRMPDKSSPPVPIIVNGGDLTALIDVMMPHWKKLSDAMRAGQPVEELNKDEINVQLARLPDQPDETLH